MIDRDVLRFRDLAGVQDARRVDGRDGGSHLLLVRAEAAGRRNPHHLRAAPKVERLGGNVVLAGGQPEQPIDAAVVRLHQAGYRVVFAPFVDGKATGKHVTIASGGNAGALRASGLAVAPDGALFLAADANGKIWRISRKE